MLTGRLFNYPSWRFGRPYSEMARMMRDMDRLLGAFAEGHAGKVAAGVFPAINLTEDKDKYYVRAELPGLSADELDIQVTGKNLSVSGERKIHSEGEKAKYHRREREAGKFSRIVGLPGDVDSEKVEATLENGILKIVIPKAEAAKPRQITVN